MTSAYSTRAAEYADVIGTMDAVHHSDRHLVEAWVRSVDGAILDAGCGPGHWTNHLARLGCNIRGIDLVPDFIQHARGTYPDVRFDQGSIESVEGPDDALGGILSWFSTIHRDPSRISVPIAEFARVLRPGDTSIAGLLRLCSRRRVVRPRCGEGVPVARGRCGRSWRMPLRHHRNPSKVGARPTTVGPSSASSRAERFTR